MEEYNVDLWWFDSLGKTENLRFAKTELVVYYAYTSDAPALARTRFMYVAFVASFYLSSTHHT